MWTVVLWYNERRLARSSKQERLENSRETRVNVCAQETAMTLDCAVAVTESAQGAATAAAVVTKGWEGSGGLSAFCRGAPSHTHLRDAVAWQCNLHVSPELHLGVAAGGGAISQKPTHSLSSWRDAASASAAAHRRCRCPRPRRPRANWAQRDSASWRQCAACGGEGGPRERTKGR